MIRCKNLDLVDVRNPYNYRFDIRTRSLGFDVDNTLFDFYKDDKSIAIKNRANADWYKKEQPLTLNFSFAKWLSKQIPDHFFVITVAPTFEIATIKIEQFKEYFGEDFEGKLIILVEECKEENPFIEIVSKSLAISYGLFYKAEVAQVLGLKDVVLFDDHDEQVLEWDMTGNYGFVVRQHDEEYECRNLLGMVKIIKYDNLSGKLQQDARHSYPGLRMAFDNYLEFMNSGKR